MSSRLAQLAHLIRGEFPARAPRLVTRAQVVSAYRRDLRGPIDDDNFHDDLLEWIRCASEAPEEYSDGEVENDIRAWRRARTEFGLPPRRSRITVIPDLAVRPSQVERLAKVLCLRDYQESDVYQLVGRDVRDEYRQRATKILATASGPVDSSGAVPVPFEFGGGGVEYMLDGLLHRLDGPAAEHASGYRAWYQHGKCHRLDGPAVEEADGTIEYYVDGQCHREDGPAVITPDGDLEFWLDGEKVGEIKAGDQL